MCMPHAALPATLCFSLLVACGGGGRQSPPPVTTSFAFSAPLFTNPGLGGNPEIDNAVADFDGNGTLDVAHPVVFGSEARIKIMSNPGNGALTETASLPARFAPPSTRVEPQSIVAGDLNEDGDPDLVLTCQDPDRQTVRSLAVFRNNGDGSFQSEQTFQVTALPGRVRVAQMDGAGRRDIVVFGDGALQVFRSLGTSIDIQLSLPNTFTLPVGLGYGGLALADYNGDTRIDVAVAHPEARSAALLFNPGNGLFSSAASPFTLFEGDLGGLTAADLDRDGDQDLLTGRGLILNDGAGTFANARALQSPAFPFQTYGAAAADFDGDGDPDVVVSTGDKLAFYRNLGGAVFEPAGEAAGLGFFVGVPVAADFNNDLLADVVVTTQSNLLVLLNLGP